MAALLFDKSQYRRLQTLSGKVKKIQKKEFLEMFSKGEFYPAEGCTLFSQEDSPVFYVYGGARAAKPGHWGQSNYLFQIQTHKVDPEDNSAHDIQSFKMFNHSTSKTSQFTKLFGASGLTEQCTDKAFLGFTVNGKDLNCPSEKLFLSSEIRIIEIASETTFRTVIIRTGMEKIELTDLQKAEHFQSGDIPAPSYGSSLVRVPDLDSANTKVAIKVGGSVLSNAHCSDLEFLFHKKKMWQEESSSEIHLLAYNLEKRIFDWKLVQVPGFEPRAFHSMVVIDRFLYIFGGLDVKTNRRFSIMPVRININDWTVTSLEIEGFSGFLSGAGALPCADKVFLVGGYTEEVVKKENKPCDLITQISFSSQGK